MIEIELVVAGIDITDPRVDAVLDEHGSGVLWGQTDGITTATVFAASPAHVEQAVEALYVMLAEHLPNATVVRVFDDLVGVSDIAQRAGLSREAVRLWSTGQRQDGSFPAPVGHLGAGSKQVAVWRWCEVNAWLTDRSLGDGVARPSSLQAVRLDARLAELAARDAVLAEQGWESVGPARDGAPSVTTVIPMERYRARRARAAARSVDLAEFTATEVPR